VEFLRVTYDVGGASCAKDALMRHGGKEYAFMISGRLGVRIGFEEFELGPGDSISFDAQSRTGVDGGQQAGGGYLGGGEPAQR